MTTRADKETDDRPASSGEDPTGEAAPGDGTAAVAGEARTDRAATTVAAEATEPQSPGGPDSAPDSDGPVAPRGLLRRARLGTQRGFGSAAAAFVVVAGIFGIVFAVITPPFWGHDEITQFGRAYQVAHGGFTPERITDDRGVSYGGSIPLSIDGLMGYAFTDYNRHPGEPEPLAADQDAYDRLGSAPVTTSATKQMWFTNTAAYSPLPYVPAAVGIRIAQAIGLDVGDTVLLTRLAGLLAYLVIVAFALRALRGFRIQWLAFTVAVLPIALFQAGTVTADTVTNALAILVSCLLVKGVFLDSELSKPEMVAALATALALPLSKPTYVVLAMLVVLIPARRYGFGNALRWLPWAFAALGAALFAVWMKIAAPTGDGMGLMRKPAEWHSVRPGDQLHEILSDPVHFVNTFGDSIWYRDEKWFTQFFGELGFAYIDVPALSMLACLLALAVSAGIADRLTGNRLRTWIVALTVLASVAMIYVTLYMSFTPVGYWMIDGVQGRYFVPLAIAGLAVVLRWMPLRLSDSRGVTPVRGPAITVVIATVVALAAAAIKYNVLVWG
ncbi:DUF2142 domain-containing protein [Nocardia veterana]|uniref:DUF2142 domain-containing protein n=1 Tax=Nocardia veterana TaxID=132249 RepID=A0A7X6RHH6_9NOCA|nr:DUF2142 domain-containing protein [Nocardia veterana]NKY85613.1 DUF2142 domain-containing protein [Nocardia veterana]